MVQLCMHSNAGSLFKVLCRPCINVAMIYDIFDTRM